MHMNGTDNSSRVTFTRGGRFDRGGSSSTGRGFPPNNTDQQQGRQNDFFSNRGGFGAGRGGFTQNAGDRRDNQFGSTRGERGGFNGPLRGFSHNSGDRRDNQFGSTRGERGGFNGPPGGFSHNSGDQRNRTFSSTRDGREEGGNGFGARRECISQNSRDQQGSQNNFFSNRSGGFGANRGGFGQSSSDQRHSSFPSSHGERGSFGRSFGGFGPNRGSSAVQNNQGDNFSQGAGFNNGGSGLTFHSSRRSSTAGDEESNNRGSFAQSRRRFYPAANVIPTGQVEFQPVAPVSVPLAPQDREEFGEEIEKQLADLTIPSCHAQRGFAPTARTVDEIYAEDEKHAGEYATIADEDDEVRFDKELDLTFIEKWEDLGKDFDKTLIENVKRAKYIKPRKIQRSALPFVMDVWDCIVIAETGSGKSATFLLPMLDACIKAKASGEYVPEPFTPFAIILAPTRELVIQTYEQGKKFAYQTNVEFAKAHGEYDVRKNKRELETACDCVVATPGRFLHFIRDDYIKLNKTKILVFDEGDHLLDFDFRKTIDEALFGFENKISNERQTLFFSATFEKPLIEIAKKYMRPKHTITIQGDICPTKKVVQEFRLCKGTYKFGSVRKLLQEEIGKVDGDLKKLPRTFIFCKTGQYCEKLSLALVTSGIPCIPLHGFRGQDLREDALNKFRNNESSILVVTDLCARGIDIKDVDLVINCDMPDDYDTFVHRVGRAGRIRHGRCVSFVSLGNDKPLLLHIKKAMEESGQIIPPSLEEMLRPEGTKERQNNEISSVKDAANNVEDVVATPGFSGHEEEKELGINEPVAAADDENVKPSDSMKEDHTSSEVPPEDDQIFAQDEEDFSGTAHQKEGTTVEGELEMVDDHFEFEREPSEVASEHDQILAQDEEEKELGMNEPVAAADSGNVKPSDSMKEDHTSSEVPPEDDQIFAQDEEDFSGTAHQKEGTTEGAFEMDDVTEDGEFYY